MAFFDDPEVLTAHLRHSFITSDDTGMCELIMVNEDLDMEIKTDNSFSKRTLRLNQRYNPADYLMHHGAKSFDIQASPTLPRRPPLRNNANLFEVVEKKKTRGSQVKTVTWNDDNIPLFDPEMFPRREFAKKNKAKQEPSMLAIMLEEYNKLSANPFFKFSKFSGENHGIGVASTYKIFLSMSKTPLQPLTITVLHVATVSDLVGLTFWKYIDITKDPVKLKSVKRYCVMIAEEDGEIDTDLPELEKKDKIAKFGFKYLGIVELMKRSQREIKSQSPPPPVVKVFYEEGGFSTLAIDDYSITMGEILATVIRKRRLHIHGYELEHEDTPGIPVDLNSTLKMHRTLDFVLVKNQGQPKVMLDASRGEDSTDLLDVKDELTFYQYKPYNVVLVNKVRSNSDIILGISGEQVEVEPVGNLKSFFPRSSKSQKPATYEMKKICGCDIIDDKNPAKNVFRVIRLSKDGGYKNMDFEAPVAITKEIVRKMTLILDGLSDGIRSEYMEWKEISRSRKGTKTAV